MIVTIIIIYVLNVFLNRWLNRIICIIDDSQQPAVRFWFIPLFITLFYIIIILSYIKIKPNWFSGKHW